MPSANSATTNTPSPPPLTPLPPPLQDINGIITLSSAQVMEELPPEPVEPPKAPDAGEEKGEVGEGDKKEGENGDEAKDGEAKENTTSSDNAASSDNAEMKDDAAPAAPKKYKKINVPFAVNTAMRFDKAQLEKAVEIESSFYNNDKLARETSDRRNELESYLYSMRDRIIGDLKEYCEDTETATFKKSLEATEEWLYSDEGFDTTKDVYEEKLKGVHKIGDPIEKRMSEGAKRPAAITSLKGTIETYRTFISSSDDRYSHITDAERESCRKACKATLSRASARTYSSRAPRVFSGSLHGGSG